MRDVRPRVMTAHGAAGDGSVSGTVLGSGKPLSIEDFSSDERAAPVAREHLHLGPAVVVPLGAPGNVRGILTAGRRPGSMPLAPPAVEMLISFAAQAGVGLELAGHRRDAERFAVFEDRDRIARDLHDLVIQSLYATGMSLESMSSRVGESGNRQRVSSAVDALDETIKEIRNAIFSLTHVPSRTRRPARQDPGSGGAGYRRARLRARTADVRPPG